MNSCQTSLATRRFMQMVKGRPENGKEVLRCSNNTSFAKSRRLLVAARNASGKCSLGTHAVDGASSQTLLSAKTWQSKNPEESTVHGSAKSSHDDSPDTIEEKHKKRASPGEENDTGKQPFRSHRSIGHTLLGLMCGIFLNSREYFVRVAKTLWPETKPQITQKNSGNPAPNVAPGFMKASNKDQNTLKESQSAMQDQNTPKESQCARQDQNTLRKLAMPDRPSRPGLRDLRGPPGQTN